MKAKILILSLCMIISLNSIAQKKSKVRVPERDVYELLKSDSVTIFVGIENKFKAKPSYSLHPEKIPESLIIDTRPEYVVIKAKKPGVFDVILSTSSGKRKVTLVAKPISSR